MGKNKSDVLIVGGGPAGSMTAYHLAKAGVNVAIIDRARLAAETILRALDSYDLNVSQYSKVVCETIWPEILHARGLLTGLNTFPRMFYRMFLKNDRLWRGFCRVLRGDDDPDTGARYNYQYFREKNLGFLKLVWRGIDPFTEAYMRKRVRKGEAEETPFQKIINLVVGPLIERI